MSEAQYFRFHDDDKRLERYEASLVDQLIGAAVALGESRLLLDQASCDGRKARTEKLIPEVADLQDRVSAFRKAVGG